ncbi:hypothetical protein RJT34_30958 [Clitoria ternatea]|uniref:Pentatricopeptide repeat-containing protein n=1 Tax=Clitoria ternatea TaxID=43366 RepID=A0AAN9EXV5_CLITE
MKKVGYDDSMISDDAVGRSKLHEETSNSHGKADLATTLAQILKDEDRRVFPLVYNFNSSIFFFCKARMIEDALKAYRRMVNMKIQPTTETFLFCCVDTLLSACIGGVCLPFADEVLCWLYETMKEMII